MSEYYYTIIRKYYGFSDYMNTDISEVEDCFAFDTEDEANECLRVLFDDGDWTHDERYGKIRHFVERRMVKHRMFEF